jgi:hypothetical protein
MKVTYNLFEAIKLLYFKPHLMRKKVALSKLELLASFTFVVPLMKRDFSYKLLRKRLGLVFDFLANHPKCTIFVCKI